MCRAIAPETSPALAKPNHILREHTPIRRTKTMNAVLSAFIIRRQARLPLALPLQWCVSWRPSRRVSDARARQNSEEPGRGLAPQPSLRDGLVVRDLYRGLKRHGGHRRPLCNQRPKSVGRNLAFRHPRPLATPLAVVNHLPGARTSNIRQLANGAHGVPAPPPRPVRLELLSALSL
jgi:hypothetical protein